MQESAEERLKRLTALVETYMMQWSRKDCYNDFRMLLSVYMTLCQTVRKEPEESLVLEHRVEEWIKDHKR